MSAAPAAAVAGDGVVGTPAEALRARLLAVAPHLLPAGEPVPEGGPGSLLARLADAVAAEPTGARLWVLASAAAAAYPTSEELEGLRRALELAAPGERLGAVLTAVAPAAASVRGGLVTAEAVELALVDVDFCATNAHNTGIQRVVRNTVKHWPAEAVELAAWAPDGSGYRRLTPAQRELATAWRSGMDSVRADTSDAPLLIPVGGAVLIPEVPGRDRIPRLAAIAEHSPARVGLIGYDAIPIVSAETVSDEESDRFAHYLAIVKHADAVSCISETTAEEFRGFGAALAAQGLSAPDVVAQPLPAVPPVPLDPGAAAPGPPRERPLVLMVGSVEPRKNQEGVLSAARILWGEGLDFELRFIGGGTAWYLHRLRALLAPLRAPGRHVELLVGAPDELVQASYRDARVVAFPSLQEGYGLPVAEALATGTPVVTSAYGSTAEIAAAGGCLVVDPRDDDAIAAALRAVLVDEEVHARLLAETGARPAGSWAAYAAEVWSELAGAAR
ncbi:glycosyltransferase [Homoserinibacter sp. YIM 151385]|uniref:glycosyltransferase n=1 Tax=Homoserinibacter sp. YIM 151385 TaxID=2985506 RepID=UPI0022F10CA6|nr:glycosyltransferase [Homoserinibacter sp. YIM 151385]WBU37783.1 glycosyltransferase [Homoserinibacter sp. YIM 151385]